MGELEPWHVAILLVLVFILFGANRMPDVARSLGRSLRIFKAEIHAPTDHNLDTDLSLDQPPPRTLSEDEVATLLPAPVSTGSPQRTPGAGD